jgi:hypothetical protein
MTAVEWLVDKLETEAITDYSFAQAHKVITLDVYTFNVLFEQAKEMEKEQIIDAYNKGEFNQGCNGNAEQYYNETFKSE